MKYISTIVQLAILALLLVSVVLLFRIERELASFPRHGDTILEIGRARPEHVRDSIWNAPLVRIQGGDVEVSGEVTVSGEVEIDQPSFRPIPVRAE